MSTQYTGKQVALSEVDHVWELGPLARVTFTYTALSFPTLAEWTAPPPAAPPN
jgi:hypothetical protein